MATELLQHHDYDKSHAFIPRLDDNCSHTELIQPPVSHTSSLQYWLAVTVRGVHLIPKSLISSNIIRKLGYNAECCIKTIADVFSKMG